MNRTIEITLACLISMIIGLSAGRLARCYTAPAPATCHCEPYHADQQLLRRSLQLHAHRISQLHQRTLRLERPDEAVKFPRHPGRLGTIGSLSPDGDAPAD